MTLQNGFWASYRLYSILYDMIGECQVAGAHPEGGFRTMDPDDVCPVEDLSPATLQALIDALERSTTREHFVYREAELDDLWRVVDTALSAARRDTRERDLALRLERLQAIAVEVHDLVGADERPREAAARLRSALPLVVSA